MWVGSSENSKTRAYINLDSAPQIGDYSVVTSAKLHLNFAGSGSSYALAAHDVCSDWDVSNINWSNQPLFDETVNDLFDQPTIDTAPVFDITNMVKDWVEGNSSDGIVITVLDESEVYTGVAICAREIGGENAPYVEIHYRDQSGLYDEYSYTELSAGNAGSVFINNYNGSEVIVRNDLTSKSNLLSFNISHIYDAHYSTEHASLDMKVGKGWRLSVQEELKEETIGNDSYLLYINELGNRVYFKQDGNTYTDVDDSGYSVSEMSTGGYEITTPYGLTKIFENGVINKTISGEYEITYQYNDNRLMSVKDASDYTAYLSYDENGYLSSITMGDHVLTFTYSGELLTAVSDNYISGSCVYSYNSNNGENLYYLKDQLGKEIYLIGSGTNKVGNVIWETEDDGNYIAQNGCSFTYDSNHMTSVRYYGNDGQSDTSDDITYNYSFGNSGEVVLEYVNNALGETIHTTSYSENNSVTSLGLTFGSISEVGYVAQTAKLSDNFESSVWSSDSGAATSVDSSEYLYGAKSMKTTFYIPNQRVNTSFMPTAGKEYTLSVYVKIPTEMSGVHLSVMDLDYNELAVSETITVTDNNLNNGWVRLSFDYTASDSIL